MAGNKSLTLNAELMHSFENLSDEEAGKLIKHTLRFLNDKNPVAPDRVTELAFAPIQKMLVVGKDKEKEMTDRKLKFANSLEPYLQIYGRTLLNDFYKYWTEPNKSLTKFRMELEQTWSLSRRLETWAKNDKNFNKTVTQEKEGITPLATKFIPADRERDAKELQEKLRNGQ